MGVKTLFTGAFALAQNAVYLDKVSRAVTIQDGKVVFTFKESNGIETAFYKDFISRVAKYEENTSKSDALVLLANMGQNPNVYTLAELAFLSKLMIEPNFTFPITNTFSAWEKIAREAPAELPLIYEQLSKGGTTQNGTTPQTDTTPTPTTTGGTSSGGFTTFLASVAGGVSVYFITKLFFKGKQ